MLWAIFSYFLHKINIRDNNTLRNNPDMSFKRYVYIHKKWERLIKNSKNYSIEEYYINFKINAYADFCKYEGIKVG